MKNTLRDKVTGRFAERAPNENTCAVAIEEPPIIAQARRVQSMQQTLNEIRNAKSTMEAQYETLLREETEVVLQLSEASNELNRLTA